MPMREVRRAGTATAIARPRYVRMHIRTPQIVAALFAAVAFLIAFIAAGVVLLSLVFGVLGALAIAWLVYGVAREMLERPKHDALPTDPRDALPRS